MIVTASSVALDLRFLLPALLLLWFPRQWLRMGALARRSRGARRKDWVPNRDRQPGDLSVWLGEELRKPRNWLDFLRALAGGAAVGGTLFPGIAAVAKVGSGADSTAPHVVLGLKALILLAGLAIQMFRFESRLSMFAPIFYVQGLAFGLLGLKASLVAIALAWAVNAVLPSAGVLLAVFGLLQVLAGLFFGQPVLVVLVAGGLTLLPVFLSLVLRRRLAQFTKRTKIIAGPSSSGG